jgi:hypothetical protein
LNQPGQPGSLSLRKLKHQAGQRRGVDDRVLERAFQSTADEPGVECVVAVLDQHRAVGEAQEGAARVSKLGCPYEHGTIDVVSPVGIRVDRRLAVDQRVEERQGAVEAEALRADLEHQEWSVSGGLDVKGDELSLVQQGLGPHLGCVDRYLLPGHGLHGPAGLEVELLGAHRAAAMARRAQSISSLVNARSSSTAPP